MNDARPIDDRDALASLDRLAAGELDDGARRALFAWLDQEPRRWRRCALVLLEAREWEGALDDWTAEMRTDAPRAEALRSVGTRPARRLAPSSTPPISKDREPWRRPAAAVVGRIGRKRALAVAASIAIAFGLGIAADRKWTAPRRPRAEVVAAAGGAPKIEARSAGDRAQQETEHPVEAHGPDQARDAGSDQESPGDLASNRLESIPAYVRSQLERRGYRVDSRRQFVSVSLPGGRKATLPVEQWNLSYVGNRVY